MDRFIVREGHPVSSAGTRRRRPADESSTDVLHSTASARRRPTAKRLKPRRKLSGLGSTAHGQTKISIVDSGSSSSLLRDRCDERPAPGSEQRLGNLNFRDGQRKTDENLYRGPRPDRGTRRMLASSEEGLTKEEGQGREGLRGKLGNAGAAVAAVTARSGAVASQPRVAFAARQQGPGSQERSVGAEERISSDHSPTRAENGRPALRTVRATQPTLRSERVTDFFPRVHRGLSLGVCGRGRPLGSTTWTGRYPPQSQDDSDDGWSEAEPGCSTGGVDVETESNDSSRPRRRRNHSDFRIPEGDRWRGTNDHHNSGERSEDVMSVPARPRDSRDLRAPSGGDGVASVVLDPPMLGQEVSKDGVSMHRPVEREIAAASGSAAGWAGAGAGPVRRSEAAERAAAAAEKRAAARGNYTVEENACAIPAGTQAVYMEEAAEIPAVASSILSSKLADGSVERVAPSSARGDDASASDPAAAEAEYDRALEDFEAIKAVQAEPEPLSPCLRLGGMSALFLTQRRSTGGRVGGAGGGVGDAGRDAFRRQALSAMFRKGLTTMRLRMGRVAGSRVGAGVVRGTPEGEDGARRITGGVSCLAFDSIGALLAAGGTENVTVYDFDEYVPQIPRVKSTLQNGVRAYLQPTHCIQTRRAVSCLRWNPANEDQLAVSFLHYDDIDVFDLRTILPDTHATPTLSLVSSSAGPADAGGGGSTRGRAGTFRGVSAGGGGGATTAASRAMGRNRGLGHLSLEFVSRREDGRDVTHLIAVGRGGAFRVWKFPRNMARRLAPYLQVQIGANPRSRAPFVGCQPRPDVTAVCCLSADVALVGTDSGTLASYSLRTPEVRAFQTGKVADRLQQWYLGDRAVWRHGVHDGASGEGIPHAEAFRIASLRPSPTHGPGVVVCGLRSGRVVVFDTRSGFVLGITRAGVPPTSAGYCDAGPYGGDWSKAILSSSKTPGGDEELLLLATSGRASLDRHRRDGGGRDSRLRPGPGWELGEAGGGGFRVQQCSGYGLCLPVAVQRAIPGERKVVLSRDARAYLCSRDATGLLRSRMVTSSIMIGGQEHSIEAVSGDGRELLLDRGYGGPGVGAGRIATRESAGVDEASAGVDTDNPGAVGLNNGSEVEGPVEDCPNCNGMPERRRPTAPGERAETGSVDPISFNGIPTLDHADARRRTVNTIEDQEGSKHDASFSRGVGSAVGSRPAPDDPWRPDGVRIFAKLRAVFPGGVDSLPDSSAAHGRLTCRWQRASSLGVSGEAENALDGDGDALSADDELPPPWSLLQVVGRAELGLPVTAITSHPRMNFLLVGLSDGTVAAVLPGGKAGKRAARNNA